MTLVINDITSGPDDPPKVELLLTDLDSAVASVTGYRLSSGVEEEVSGIIRARVAGAGSWIDHEVPAQRSTYRFELFDAAGVSLGFTESASIELGFSGCWMHSSLAPSTAVKVSLAASATASLSRPVPGSVVYPKGRRVGVVVAGPRRGLSGVVFDVRAEDLETADKIQGFLGSEVSPTVPVLCIRMGVDHAGVRVRSPLFLAVFDIAEESINVAWGGGEDTMQRIQGDEAARPAPGIFIPLLRRKDLNAYYASRAALNSSYLTRLAANRDYPLAGYSGD